MKSRDDIGAKVDSSVNELKIIHDLIEINADFADTAAFCEQYNFPLDHCGNTIIVAAKKPPGEYCACIVGGSERLDVNQTVKKLMRVSRLSFASAEETQNLTGMMIGGDWRCHPFRTACRIVDLCRREVTGTGLRNIRFRQSILEVQD